MVRVKETIKGTIDFKFQIGEKIFEETSDRVSCEWENYDLMMTKIDIYLGMLKFNIGVIGIHT